MTTEAAPDAPSVKRIAPGSRPSRNSRWAGALLAGLALVFAGLELAYPPLVLWRGWKIYNIWNSNLPYQLDHMAVDQDGRVWTKSFKTAYVLDANDEWIIAQQPMGLFADTNPLQTTSGARAHDAEGRLWYANESGVRVRALDGTQLVYSPNNSLQAYEFLSMAIDSTGVVWLGTARSGVMALDPQAALPISQFMQLRLAKAVIDWSVIAILGLCFTGWAASMTRQRMQWVLWYGTTVAGWTAYWLAGWVLAEVAQQTFYFPMFPIIAAPLFVLFALVGGGLTGAGQLPAIGPWLRRPKWWLPATIGSWLVVGVCLLVARERNWLISVGVGVWAGAVAGLIQLPSLLGKLPRAGWWVPVVAISLSYLSLMGGAYSDRGDLSLEPAPFLAGAAIASTIMGVGFICLTVSAAPAPAQPGAE